MLGDILQDPSHPKEEITFVPSMSTTSTTPTFALHPATVTNTVLDYSTSEGIKIYKTNTAALPVKFDLSTSKLCLFLETLRNRATTAGWNPILTFTIGTDSFNLLNEYGLISKKRSVLTPSTMLQSNLVTPVEYSRLLNCLFSLYCNSLL